MASDHYETDQQRADGPKTRRRPPASPQTSIPSARRKKQMGTGEKSVATSASGRRYDPITFEATAPKPDPAAQKSAPREAPSAVEEESVPARRSRKEGKTSRRQTSQTAAKRTAGASRHGGSNVRKKIIGLVVVLIFAVAVIAGFIGFYNYNLQPVGSSTDKIIVEIPDGSTVNDVAQILYDNGLIRNAMVFESYAGRHSRGSKQIQAANYAFTQSMSVEEIFNAMLDGNTYNGVVAVTIPEGRNIKEMGQILEDAHICSSADFIAETQKITEYKAKYPILSGVPENNSSRKSLEGYLFADTYNWNSNTAASKVVSDMVERFVDVYDAGMQQRTTEMGKTVDQIVIMGSIVELETKLPEDKANCASVFYNRMAAGMPLQSDITVDYALGTKNAVLTEAQTQVDSPYNTYKNLGLPVGPICSPGKSSLEAALYPASTNYLYFVADMNTGKLYFNATLEGHEADVQKYMGN